MSERTHGSRLPSMLLALVALAAVVAAAWLGFNRYVREPTASADSLPAVVAPVQVAIAPAVDAGTFPAQARIVAVKGDVQRRASGDSWAEVKQGEVLLENERLRTASGASAELSLGGRGTFNVAESTEVGVIELSEAVNRFRLIKGRVTADHASDGRQTLRIEGEQGQTVTAQNGRFSVLATGTTFVVAAERGRVNLESAGKVIAVDEGSESVVRNEGPPSAPKPISAEVLLLASRGRGRGCSEIVGSAPAGSEVTVGETVVAADEQGHFQVRLPPSAQTPELEVRTRDAAGREQTRVLKCPRPAKNSEVNAIAIERWHKQPR